MSTVNIPSITGLRLPGKVRAVWALLALYVLMFLVTYLVSFLVANDPFCRPSPYNCALFMLGWKQNALIYQGEYWRLLTATFLHGGIAHLAMNSFSLFILGPDTERVYGTGYFLALYFLSGLAGSIMSYAFSPSPSVGASGAIFGLFGGLAVFFYTARGVLGEFGASQLRGIGVILFINLLFGLSTPGIDNWGHGGGLLGGAVAGWLLVPRYELDRSYFTPTIVQRKRPLGWVGAGALLVVLVVLALVVPPA
jgi:rhomboid protease GluP